ncbi:helix-turn-helix transcriptional regulator, partial [Dermacoccus sp. NHGro5]
RLLTKPHLVPRTDDLRQLRHERGATLLDVALSLGAEPARISELERGRRPNAELATAYRAWLDVA